MISRNKIRKYFQELWILLFPILFYCLYQYVAIAKFGKVLYLISLLITILLVFDELKKKNYKQSLYAPWVRLIFISMLISMIMAFVFWKQSLLLSFRVTSINLGIIYFFYLRKARPNIEFVEKVIWTLFIVYLLLWLYQLSKAPELVFGDFEKEIDDKRGFFRFFIPGKGIIFLSFFLAISKFIETKKNIWIIIFVLIFLVIVMHVIRQLIFFAFIIGLFFILRKKKTLWLWISISVLFVLVVSPNVKISDDSALGKMVALSEDQISDQKAGEENVRITEYRFYFFEYSKNIVTTILGNGSPHYLSSFGKREIRLNEEKKLYQSDVGYANIFAMLGIVGLFLYGMVFYNALKQKVPDKYLYAKMFMVFLIPANIAASWCFHFTICICISLYVLDYSYRQQIAKP